MPHYHDPDPTPAHGTPRPKPCSVIGCEWVTIVGEYCTKHTETLAGFSSVAEFVEAWASGQTDHSTDGDLVAVRYVKKAFDTLHALLLSNQLADSVLYAQAVGTASKVLGWKVCDGCDDFTDPDQINQDNLCPSCVFDAMSNEEQDATTNPFGSALER